MNKYIEHVRKSVADHYRKPHQSTAHRMDHIHRVLEYAHEIAAAIPNVDMEVLTLAILLHDVDQPFNQKAKHVQLSQKRARKVLNEAGLPEDIREKVLTIIAEHSTETIHDITPSSVEAKILFDADKIDGVGASGIARVFSLFGQMEKDPLAALPWYRSKIAVSLAHMQTEIGRHIFQGRLSFVEEFLKKMELENSAILRSYDAQQKNQPDRD